MKKIVTYENVAFACAKLKEDGEKITGRSVLEMTGGSFGTVLKYLKQWREQGDNEMIIPTQIPDFLVKEITQALWQATNEGKSYAENQIKRSAETENEAINALRASENKISKLEETLEACREEHRAKLQQSETQVALLSEKVSVANKEAERLNAEHGVKVREISGLQIKNAELMQQVSSAEKSLEKSETRLDVMQGRIDQLINSTICLEKEKAIAELKFQDSRQFNLD